MRGYVRVRSARKTIQSGYFSDIAYTGFTTAAQPDAASFLRQLLRALAALTHHQIKTHVLHWISDFIAGHQCEHLLGRTTADGFSGGANTA